MVTAKTPATTKASRYLSRVGLVDWIIEALNPESHFFEVTLWILIGVIPKLEFRQRLPNLTRGQVGDFSVILSYLNGLCGGFCR